MRLVTLLSAVCLLAQATVIGVDFGTHWLKISIIKPGGLLETVLNRESKRKTENMITIRDGIRYFGFDSVSLGMRFPQITFSSLKNLLGKRFDSDAAKEYRDAYSNVMVEDPERHTCAFTLGTETYRVEELVAMLLQHAKRQAEAYAKIDVSGAVITVPPYFVRFALFLL